MPSFRTGRVTAILSERAGLQRIEVDGRRAYVLTELVPMVVVGDEVVVNTTAVELGLGTGGWDVVHWNLARDAFDTDGDGHIMKLRYTSLQHNAGVAEEVEGYDPPAHLGGCPVVACFLHSQIACVAAAFAAAAPGRRLVYVMTDSAALPLALSDLVADLRDCGLLAATVTAGHAFGGTHEAVNVASSLEVAVGVARADAIVVGSGPGVVGTASRRGFSGLEVAAIIDAATAVGARPIVAARYSEADGRERHRGISHHTRTALGDARAAALVAVPEGWPIEGLEGISAHEVRIIATPDVPALLAAAGLAVTTMGRGPADDPGFYAFAGAAGTLAAALLPPP
jgi:hypothetical protein